MKAIAALLLCVVIIEVAEGWRSRPRSDAPRWCKSYDCPAFTVLERTRDYELREYAASNWVSTDLSGIDYRRSSSPMFMKLFGYIQGANTNGDRIDMTVPVRTRITPAQGQASAENFTMSFFLAPEVTNPPQPTDDTVYLDSQPKFTVYVSEFGGFIRSIEAWARRADQLSEALDRDGKSYETSYFYTNGYDSPWTFFNRHNEVWLLKL